MFWFRTSLYITNRSSGTRVLLLLGCCRGADYYYKYVRSTIGRFFQNHRRNTRFLFVKSAKIRSPLSVFSPFCNCTVHTANRVYGKKQSLDTRFRQNCCFDLLGVKESLGKCTVFVSTRSTVYVKKKKKNCLQGKKTHRYKIKIDGLCHQYVIRFFFSYLNPLVRYIVHMLSNRKRPPGPLHE